MVRQLRPVCLLVLCALLLAACATPATISNPDDPWEEYNRSSFNTFLFLDRNALRPAAGTYRDVVPEPVRISLENVLQNLDTPGIFANDVLRGRIDPAGTALSKCR